ncbi:hypothetical protein Clacol_001223 [Clathrus columnatus]|uniref:Uncharacterized protein n=1 Tax=Clathrus columnatus TaxID=1419009 RepID=A0AAV5A1Y7_9AGAM|nr:hypothetical protein Clacol_001223 [Clathrus columnatus]
MPSTAVEEGLILGEKEEDRLDREVSEDLAKEAKGGEMSLEIFSDEDSENNAQPKPGLSGQAQAGKSLVQFLPAEERREAAERRKHIQERIRTLRDEGITLHGRKSKVLQNTTGSSAINQSISTSLHLSSDILPVLSLPTTNNDPLFSLPYSHANGTVIDLDPELDPGSYFGHSNGRVSEYSPTTDVFGPILGQGLGRGLGFNETGDFVKQWQY